MHATWPASTDPKITRIVVVPIDELERVMRRAVDEALAAPPTAPSAKRSESTTPRHLQVYRVGRM